MAFEVSHTAARGGGAARERVEELIKKTETLAARAGNAHARGLAIWARGLSSYLMGHWREAAENCERAAEILRDQCTGATWELTIANRFMLTSLLYLGEMVEISRRVPQLPDVPTLAELGFPRANLASRFGLFAPGGTAPERLRRLNAAVDAALQQPAIREALLEAGSLPLGGSAEAFADEIARSNAQIARAWPSASRRPAN